MGKLTDNLEAIADRIRRQFSEKDEAREKALGLSRETIRFSSAAIRALHRQEFDEAREMLRKARLSLDELDRALVQAPDLQFAGFIHDAEKEYAEGSATLALVRREPLPDPETLRVNYPAYLHGIGEAVGELRRYLLDGIRRDDLSRSEELMAAMDDIYGVLVTMDFPDGLTFGLRRTTDVARSILEKTRGDLTVAFEQRGLQQRMERLEKKLDSQ
ncbi:MAG: haloacid dehalogenase [Chloroflexi bacterium]|nr:haloacid dehalogenase [Chloroflexota bacterium]